MTNDNEDVELVKDSFNIDKDNLAEKAGESEYWENCEKFYLQVCDKDVSTLSIKQMDWLERIEGELSRG